MKGKRQNMFKRLCTIVLILTMLASTSVPIHADQVKDVNYFNRDIYVNGEKIINYQSATPYFQLENRVYIPLSAENSKIYGFQVNVDTENKIIKLSKSGISQKNYANKSLTNTKSSFQVKETGYRLFYVPETDAIASEETTAEITDASIEVIADEGMPQEQTTEQASEEEFVYLDSTKIYSYQNTLYVSLSVLATVEELGWSCHYSPYAGLYVSTSADKEAKAYLNQKTVTYNKNIVNFIIKKNGSIKEVGALDLLYLIRQKSQIYKVDELLVISLIANESSFNVKAVSKGGALGLMQIMPSTGAKAGLTKAQLLTAEGNLDFGVKYLANSIKNYDNSWVKGLSSYNQGSQAVSRGSYSRTYYTKVMNTYNSLKANTGK